MPKCPYTELQWRSVSNSPATSFFHFNAFLYWCSISIDNITNLFARTVRSCRHSCQFSYIFPKSLEIIDTEGNNNNNYYYYYNYYKMILRCHKVATVTMWVRRIGCNTLLLVLCETVTESLCVVRRWKQNMSSAGFRKKLVLIQLWISNGRLFHAVVKLLCQWYQIVGLYRHSLPNETV